VDEFWFVFCVLEMLVPEFELLLVLPDESVDCDWLEDVELSPDCEGGGVELSFALEEPELSLSPNHARKLAGDI